MTFVTEVVESFFLVDELDEWIRPAVYDDQAYIVIVKLCLWRSSRMYVYITRLY